MFITIGAMLLASLGGALPTALADVLTVLSPVFIITMVVGVLTSFALFPTGSFPSAGWSRVFVVFLLGWALFAGYNLVSGALQESLVLDGLTGAEAFFAGMSAIYGLVVIASIVDRYRRGDTVTRHQLKWFLTAVAFAVPFMVAPESWSTALGYVSSLGVVFVIVAIGIAIMKYRLYDIDIIINRAIVFVVLAAFITLVYAVVVVGIGSLVDSSSLWLSIGATAAVAVLFEPVRQRVQGWVNRLVYGRRATPYEVLSEVTSQMADAEFEAGLLDRMADSLRAGTGADRAVVWTRDGATYRAMAIAPDDASGPGHRSLADLPGHVDIIRHDDDTLGALTVEFPPGSSLNPTEQRLVEDLAGSAGPVLRRLQLDADLAARADELQDSRRRLVEAQDEERKRLERDLHDGAQQQVVGLSVKLGVAARVAATEGSSATAELLDQLGDDAREAVDQIRSLARGIYPPLLDSDGLDAAVRSVAAGAPVPVEVDVVGLSRYPAETEAAIYFTVSEAVTNAVKHGESPIAVRLAGAEEYVEFAVTDGGPGFDPRLGPGGSGLVNMRDRIEAVGGILAIEGAVGSPTIVKGNIPV
jgi:signal transduction histidine kinase